MAKTIMERFRDGEAISAIAIDLDRSPSEIEAAIRTETLAARPAPQSELAAGAWTASDSQEEWVATEYASRAEAIAQGPVDLDLEPGATYWTGRTERAEVVTPSGAGLIELLWDATAGEIDLPGVDAWLEGLPEEALDDLEMVVHAVIVGWLEGRGLLPIWCDVVHVEEHVYALAPEQEAAGAGPAVQETE